MVGRDDDTRSWPLACVFKWQHDLPMKLQCMYIRTAGWYKPAQTRYGNKQEGAYFHPRLGLVMPWPGCENQERTVAPERERGEKEREGGERGRRKDKKGRKRSRGGKGLREG